MLKKDAAAHATQHAADKKAQKRHWYVTRGRGDEDMVPFYEQPAYGGKKVAEAVRTFRQQVADGTATPY